MKITLAFLFIMFTCAFYSGKTDPQKYPIKSEQTISFGKQNRINGMKKTPDGNYSLILRVMPDSGKPVEVQYGVYYFLKISPNGDTLGKKRVDIPHFLADYVECKDCFYVVTTDMRTMGGYTKDYLCKYDKNWKLLWSKNLDKPKFPDGKTVITVTDKNELLLISDYYIRSNKETFSFQQGIAVRRYSLSGKIISEKLYQKFYYSNPVSLIQTFDNNYLLTVESLKQETKETNNLWLLKLNSAGDTLSTGLIDDFSPERTIQTKDSCFVIYGSNYSDSDRVAHYHFLNVVKLDRKGNLLWKKEIKENYYESAGGVIETSKGNYLFASVIEPIKNKTDSIYIFELDKNGNRIYEHTFEYHADIITPAFLIQGDKQIILISQAITGKYGETPHTMIRITKLAE